MASEIAAAPVSIPANGIALRGDLSLAAGAHGLVIFVHGSGSSRFSRRNRSVAAVLNGAGFSTLLADLLTPEEDAVDARTAEFRFDIPMLAGRTMKMIDWAVAREPGRSVGLFGASTGAAAAIIAATQRPDAVGAVVSRGGRVDLAGAFLEQLRAPLLMIAGELDYQVIALHERVLPRLRSAYGYEIVPAATHLFEEPGALERVAALAADWFTRYLAPH